MIAYLLTVLFFAYEFIVRLVPGTQQAVLMEAFHLNHSQFAMLSSTSFVLPFTIMQFPVAFLLKQYHLKVVMSLSLTTCIIGCILMAVADNLSLIFLSRTMMGIGTASAYLCVLESIQRFSKSTQTKTLIGLSTTIAFFITFLITPYLAKYTLLLGHQVIYLITAGVGSLLCASALIFIPDYTIEATEQFGEIKKSTAAIFSHRYIIYSVIFSGMLYCPLEYICENEGMILFQSQGFSEWQASHMISSMWLGYAMGTSLSCWLANYVSMYHVMKASSAISLLSLTLLIYGPIPSWHYPLSLCFGIATGSHILTYYQLSLIPNTHLKTTALALNQVLLGTGMSITAPMIGLLIDYNRVYHNILSAYHLSLWMLVIIILSSFFLAYQIHRNRQFSN